MTYLHFFYSLRCRIYCPRLSKSGWLQNRLFERKKKQINIQPIHPWTRLDFSNIKQNRIPYRMFAEVSQAVELMNTRVVKLSPEFSRFGNSARVNFPIRTFNFLLHKFPKPMIEFYLNAYRSLCYSICKVNTFWSSKICSITKRTGRCKPKIWIAYFPPH